MAVQKTGVEDLLDFVAARPPGGSPWARRCYLVRGRLASCHGAPPACFLCYSHAFYRAFLAMRTPVFTLFLFLFSFFFFSSFFRLVPS